MNTGNILSIWGVDLTPESLALLVSATPIEIAPHLLTAAELEQQSFNKFQPPLLLWRLTRSNLPLLKRYLVRLPGAPRLAAIIYPGDLPSAAVCWFSAAGVPLLARDTIALASVWHEWIKSISLRTADH